MSARQLRMVGLRAQSLPARRLVHCSLPRETPTSNGHASSHVQAHGHSHPKSSHNQGAKKPNPHADWYREIVPAMLPIFVISTTLFLSLSLLRTHLSHSKLLSESEERIAQLEGDLQRLRLEQRRQRVREKKERERILPLVVERVLQSVGVVGGDEEEVKEEKRLL